MYCQWCAKERDPDALAIHYCGPTDRAPAFCMGCGAPLVDEAATCGACGTPSGEEPARVVDAPSAPVVVVDQASLPPGAGPVGQRARPTAAAAVRAQATVTAETARTLRRCMLAAAIVGTLAFFVPWGISGVGGPVGNTLYRGLVRGFPDGITIAELQPTHAWGPPSANLMLGLALAALVLSIAMVLGAHGAPVAAAIAVCGAGLAAFCFDWLWLGRHFLDVYTGLWVVTAAGVALFGFALTYLLRRAGTAG